ncbi:MAG: hypothetical protein ABWY80_07875 [Acidimicrobiia bacterium]
MGLAALPRRDADARDRLEQLGVQARPMVLARERAIELGPHAGADAGGLAALVPGGALTRGSVLRVVGDAGATTVGFELAAAVTAVGEWAAVVDLDSSLGALAAAEAGVALERFAVVRRVPPARWATAVAALIDGVSLVLADVPRGVQLGDARRLVARARERETVLVVHERDARWPGDAALTLHVVGATWTGIVDAGHLTHRSLQVRAVGRGVAARAVTSELARAV